MQTDKPDVGYIVDYGDDMGQSNGYYINLNTFERDFHSPGHKPIIDKLWINYDDLKQRLLEQTPENEREHAEFYGFRQGHWRDPDTVQWGADEGPLTMTVYNIEVEDTRSYFVGEAGIWVGGSSQVSINP